MKTQHRTSGSLGKRRPPRDSSLKHRRAIDQGTADLASRETNSLVNRLNRGDSTHGSSWSFSGLEVRLFQFEIFVLLFFKEAPILRALKHRLLDN